MTGGILERMPRRILIETPEGIPAGVCRSGELLREISRVIPTRISGGMPAEIIGRMHGGNPEELPREAGGSCREIPELILGGISGETPGEIYRGMPTRISREIFGGMPGGIP